jgi:hypothetical protein
MKVYVVLCEHIDGGCRPMSVHFREEDAIKKAAEYEAKAQMEYSFDVEGYDVT